jgi:hypothetical protein
MALDATIGGASSNSYVTRAEATTYFGDRLDVDEWDDATNAQKDAALVMATLRLEQEDYVGSRADEDQNLKWPRMSVYIDNVYQDSADIPRPIKEATYELALAILKDNTLLADTGLEGFESVKLGEMDVVPRFRAGGTLPAEVTRLLRGIKTSAAYSARLLKT